MHAKGHFGLTLLVLSVFSIPIGFGPDNVMIFIIIISAGLSSIPDVDIRLGIKHRGLTHNILFAIIIGILFGILFGYSSGLVYGLIGFVSGFLGVMLHLLGDLMTYQPFKPLWPFDKREISYGFFAAKSKTANKGFLTLGIVAFMGYIIISSGVL